MTRNQMPRSTSDIVSAASADSLIAAFDPFANARYAVCLSYVLYYMYYCLPVRFTAVL